MDDLSLEELRARLREAEETLYAIRHGEVDAIVMGTDGNRQVYTLDSADRPYRVLVEQMQEGALMLSGDGIVLYANQRAGEILNLPAGQLVGRTLVDFVPAAEQATVARMLAECASAPARVELNLPLPDKKTPVVFSFKGLENEPGQDRVICAVISDLTQQRQFEARLNQAQKMEAIGQLTGGLAHDFNNLLQAVHGNLELISRMPTEAQRVVRWAESGLRAVDRGAKLTAQLLAFSRSQQLTLGPVAVTGLLEGMADLFTRTLGTSVEVRLALSPEPATVLADATQLELAVLNLAINARDAMPRGGTLVISTVTHQIKGEIDLPDGAYLELSVSDSGTGMSPDVISRAFEPFFTTKELGSGTGLGLAQVYGICRQAGGHVRIASAMGRGTTVSMFLKHVIEQEGKGEEATVAKALPSSHQSPKILVIDDDHDVRSFIVETLETLGYRVDSADNGTVGLELMSAALPDLVILDFAMPHLDGASVAKRAREFGLTAPIIFVSGYADTSALSAVAGTDVALLRKPFTISSLSDIVASTLAVEKSKA
jgi:PAS domain S-box-containing protein